jgi:hypothetical protein
MAPCDGLPLAAAVLLSADNAAKIGDVGLARFMAADYMSAQAAVGTCLSHMHLNLVLHQLQPTPHAHIRL